MPMPLWMSGGVTIAAAAVMGLSLGSYATSPQGYSPVDELAMDTAAEDDAPTFVGRGASPEAGPAFIQCTGCGPTLAERQWRADMAGYDPDGMIRGTSDPVVEDYQARDVAEDAAIEAAPSPIHQLPPNIVRFAAGPSPSPAVAQPAMAPPAVTATVQPVSATP